MNKKQLWKKRGLIYATDAKYPWSITHAQVPVVDDLGNGTWRVLFATRDLQGRSCIAYVDVEAGQPQNITGYCDKPLLTRGALGTFDDCGVMPSCIAQQNGIRYLYYIGWTVRNTIPYHNSIGIAVSEDNGSTYTRLYDGPVITSSATEPYFCGTSCVVHWRGKWRNWYLSCTEWIPGDDRPEPRYHIKYAESEDGVAWDRPGIVAIDYKSDDEGGIVKASVLPKTDGSLGMWYSYRKAKDYRQNRLNSYRIGYAESMDAKTWTRLDERVRLDVSDSGWDSDMLAYPEVLIHSGEIFMLYNGNGFGRSGFGYATISNESETYE